MTKMPLESKKTSLLLLLVITAFVCSRAACSFTEVGAGKGTKLNVAVSGPAESHEDIKVGQVESWLLSRGKSPREQSTKTKLGELLG